MSRSMVTTGVRRSLAAGKGGWLTWAMAVDEVARRLPGIAQVRDRSRALAMLDAILCPQWGWRYYSFDAHWGPGLELASMRNGCGDEYSIVFSPAGAYLRVFDHESPMSPWRDLQAPRPWPGVLESVPQVFRACVEEPAFALQGVPAVTACLWRQAGDDRWHAGKVIAPSDREDPDGAGWLLELLLEDSPDGYRQFAEEYYEVAVDTAAVAAVYAMQPLTRHLVATLNPDRSLAELAEDLPTIGYPTATAS
jgi:hypothetical protein